MRSVILTFVLAVIPIYQAQECQPDKSSSCVCKSGSFTLDLRPLLDNSEKGKPLFTVDGQEKDVKYFYKPCDPFNEGDGDGCKEVAVCQHASNTDYYSLGRQSTATFSGDPHKGGVTLIYSETSQGSKRTAHVQVVCSKQSSPEFKFVKQEPGVQQETLYYFELHTDLACVPKGGLSVGSILLIISFVFLLIYLIGGMLFLRFVRGAKGWEQVPNYEFWYEFPLYVRDGVVFTINGCKTETTYEKI